MAMMLALQPSALAVSKMTATVHSANCGLGSLVFDCEVEERQSTALAHASIPARSKEQLAQDKERLAHFSAPANSYASQLLRDVRYFVKEERDSDAILLATKLSAVGYSVVVRTALGGGAACFRNLRHEFLTVRGGGNFEGVEFIVESQFREHFAIPHPTEEYSELLGHAPEIFVGTSARLVPIVQTLCALMAESFEAKGLTLPPWRRTQSMLSKWLPNRVRDTCFTRASAPAAENPDHHSPQCALPASAAAAKSSESLAFSRLSDPLEIPATPKRPQQPLNQQPLAKQQESGTLPPDGVQDGCRRDQGNQGGYNTSQEDAGYASCFIPFGGAGGCSSDTEGQSPPEAAAMRPQRPGHPRVAAAAAHLGQSRKNSSLLAARLQAGAPGGGVWRDVKCAVETRPPAHWGEAPIHKVRMGFNLAASRIGQQQQQGPQQHQGQQGEQQQQHGDQVQMGMQERIAPRASCR